MLTFIVLACHLNVAIPDETSPSCKVFIETLMPMYNDEELTPYTCMMRSMIRVVKFAEEHPGWQPRKWTCRYKKAEQDI